MQPMTTSQMSSPATPARDSAARLAVAAPWVVLLLLATQSTTLSAYDTPVGTVILLGGGAVCLGAYRLMLRIGRLPQDVRVLQ